MATVCLDGLIASEIDRSDSVAASGTYSADLHGPVLPEVVVTAELSVFTAGVERDVQVNGELLEVLRDVPAFCQHGLRLEAPAAISTAWPKCRVPPEPGWGALVAVGARPLEAATAIRPSSARRLMR